MRPMDFRDLIRELRRLLAAHGISVEVDTGRGKGSHRAVILRHEATGECVKFIVAGTNEVSPGVQRRALAYLRELAVKSVIAAIIHEIIRTILDP